MRNPTILRKKEIGKFKKSLSLKNLERFLMIRILTKSFYYDKARKRNRKINEKTRHSPRISINKRNKKEALSNKFNGLTNGLKRDPIPVYSKERWFRTARILKMR
jgi:hypothetical protein